jgi:hypothetical protein
MYGYGYVYAVFGPGQIAGDNYFISFVMLFNC